MTTTNFDTFKATRDLEEAGVERRQAEAHVRVIRDAAAADHTHTEFATKADVVAQVGALRSEM